MALGSTEAAPMAGAYSSAHALGTISQLRAALALAFQVYSDDDGGTR